MGTGPSWTAGERVAFVLGVTLLFGAVVLGVLGLSSGAAGWFVAAGIAVVVGFGTLVVVALHRIRRLGPLRRVRGGGSSGRAGGSGSISTP